jgi:D-alanine transaminase
VDLEELNITGLIEQGVRRAGLENTMVYVQLTRGAAPRNHIYPRHREPTVVMTFKPKPVVEPDKRRRGVAVMTVADIRWSRCDIKSIALLPNVMAKNEALANGFDDAVFIGPEGDVREASGANLFIIQDGCLLTHPTDATILPGITRMLVLSCAARIDLPVREVCILHGDLLSADEAFLCSTVIDVLPLVRVDDHVIGPGTPGRHTLALYEQMVQQTVEEFRS